MMTTTLVKQMTLWLDVPGYEGRYQVSNEGAVRNAKHRSLKIVESSKGYQRVWLSTHGKLKCHPVHRLVAAAFLSNPTQLPEVNHINGIKTDNRVQNLEWCTISHNRWHSAYVLQNESGKPKRAVVCLDIGVTYPSAAEAARVVSGCKQNIVKCCQGKRQRHKGLRWAYAEEEKA